MAWYGWEEYHRHPWLLQVDNSRPWIGPNGSDRYEWQLAAIEGAGFTDLEMDQVVTLVSGFTAGAISTSHAMVAVLVRRCGRRGRPPSSSCSSEAPAFLAR